MGPQNIEVQARPTILTTHHSHNPLLMINHCTSFQDSADRQTMCLKCQGTTGALQGACPPQMGLTYLESTSPAGSAAQWSFTLGLNHIVYKSPLPFKHYIFIIDVYSFTFFLSDLLKVSAYWACRWKYPSSECVIDFFKNHRVFTSREGRGSYNRPAYIVNNIC